MSSSAGFTSTRGPANPYPYHNARPHPHARHHDPRHVHFADDLTPSALTLRIKLGPNTRPTAVIKISIYFEAGLLPRIRVKTKRPKDRRRRRVYVDDAPLRY
ncbi:hypothetical protein AC579_3598 [Pseudocercospora musae]|uniref:Uncharacterized protein n=1 Tax=Pseudocercospora musae TaxID=113226 RepID=A0A139IT29_9PEZI|nr:hypothetical protein AC579_3598 [Pseudocercospora musae]